MNISPLISLSGSNTQLHSIALILNDREITYSELTALVNKAVNFLSAQGINENDLVTLLYTNSFEFVVTVLSLWKIGAVPVPLNIKLTEKELNEQIEFLNPVLTIKEKKLNHISLRKPSTIISFDDTTENIREVKEINFSPDKIAIIIFTSGSSGKPKAVMLSFDNLIQSALAGNKVLKQTNHDRWLASLPFYHIGGFSIIVRALMFGASIIIPDSLSNEELRKAIKNYKPTLASLVSPQLKNFVEEKFIPNKELKRVLLGGGFSDQDLILRAIDDGWNIAKVYGSTETSSFISFMDTNEVKKKPGASGKAVPPNKINITETGEIIVSSPAVMKGYFNDEEETASKIKNDFYYTGDAGYLDDDNYLFVEAKRNDLIITGGENVDPKEVEDIIISHKCISEACVVGIDNEKWGQIISAALVLKEGCNFSESELKDFLKERLANFKVPKKLVFVNQLPKTGLGKLQKEKVKQLFKN